jgi:aminoglycoside 3-N-acetyltransferase
MHGKKKADDIKQIARDLESTGVRRGGVLLVHASLSSMGYVTGGPDTVIRGIMEALGPEGTLLMPALSHIYVTEESPVFDVKKTRSNIGVIAEYFRKMKGTVRSVHPTHSACGLGPLAEQLLNSHIRDATPCGPHSPFRLLPRHHGQILMLGCGLAPNTSMHAIEEIVSPPYLYGPLLSYKLILGSGKSMVKEYRSQGFFGWKHCYERVEKILGKNNLKHGTVLEADTILIEATSLWNTVLPVLRRYPLYFVERLESEHD